MTKTPPVITGKKDVIQIILEPGKAPQVETNIKNPEHLAMILHQVYLKVLFNCFNMWGSQMQSKMQAELQHEANTLQKLGRTK